jgi:hypothetical protein
MPPPLPVEEGAVEIDGKHAAPLGKFERLDRAA